MILMWREREAWRNVNMMFSEDAAPLYTVLGATEQHSEILDHTVSNKRIISR